MEFKTPELQSQFARCHPRLQVVVMELDEWLIRRNWHCVVLTHIQRTRKNQGDIYWRLVKQQNPNFSDEMARTLASQRPTLHFHMAAVDLRDYVYTKEQILEILSFVRELVKVEGHKFELLNHNVGSGNHFHIGIFDDAWTKDNPPKEK